MDALKNLQVWRRACRLSADLYTEMAHCRDLGFKDQVTRSGLSIPSNIAEGYERDSMKERARFLKIAKGSCGELWTQILIGKEAGLLDGQFAAKVSAETRELSKMLHGLIGYCNKASEGPLSFSSAQEPST